MGAVGISSATVTIPATKVASRYVVTVTTDNVANQPYPQDVPGFGGSFAGQLSNAMNPASYSNNALGGTVDVWDSLNHVAAALPASTLIVPAVNPGGLVRASVSICPL